ncbi:hypothetical protein C1H46_009330 [Malus baccata]|uniref:non-specific serine/threonine protein kinase n=1 Tax=Malus baccata TaxID=106549 RepID=A0A540N1U6_MALBA|nr:hypothetical protein C1H46_009330 [Malus baccata]
MSNLSFNSRQSSSISVCSSATEACMHSFAHKPHKANQAAWEAMRWLRSSKRRVGLEHFCLLRRLGSKDIGNVYICQIRNPIVGYRSAFMP